MTGDEPKTPRIAVLALGRSTFDVDLARDTLDQALALLSELADIIGSRELLMDGEALGKALDDLSALDEDAIDIVLVLQVTFTDAEGIVRISERFGDRPLAIWSFPEPRRGGRLRLNSFCGLNLAAHALGRIDRKAGMLYTAPTSEARDAVRDLLRGGRVPSPPELGPAEVDTVASPAAARAIARLQGARIARLGEHPPGFDTCDYDERRLDALAGVVVEPIELEDVFAIARNVSSSALARSRAVAERDCGDLSGVSEDELDKSLRLEGALQDIREAGRYDGFAVRCWPECFTEYGGAMCAPVAMMGERHVPCACEADVYGALSSLMLQAVAEAPVFMVDLVDLDPGDETGVVWHCGQAPISMSAGHAHATKGGTGEGMRGGGDNDTPLARSSARATVHTNRRMALLYEFALRPGRVTLARLSQARGTHSLVLIGAEAIERPAPFTGTCGTLRFDRSVSELTNAILGAGLEHHTSLVYGDHRMALRQVAAELGLPVLSL